VTARLNVQSARKDLHVKETLNAMLLYIQENNCLFVGLVAKGLAQKAI
jgi:hypothetical protein